MVDRLTRITTGRGDAGESRLASGDRLPKQDPVFHALGSVDELNSAIGQALSLFPEAEATAAPEALRSIRESLVTIQSRLFDLGGALAMPEAGISLEAEVAALERVAEAINAELEPLRNFILPGGSACGAALHAARTICRRAERDLWTLLAARPQSAERAAAVYLNRLSDALFIYARRVNKALGTPEPLWQPMPKPTERG